jgi:hypothetical protein
MENAIGAGTRSRTAALDQASPKIWDADDPRTALAEKGTEDRRFLSAFCASLCLIFIVLASTADCLRHGNRTVERGRHFRGCGLPHPGTCHFQRRQLE